VAGRDDVENARPAMRVKRHGLPRGDPSLQHAQVVVLEHEPVELRRGYQRVE
jgi:hypothetical protein